MQILSSSKFHTNQNQIRKVLADLLALPFESCHGEPFWQDEFPDGRERRNERKKIIEENSNNRNGHNNNNH